MTRPHPFVHKAIVATVTDLNDLFSLIILLRNFEHSSLLFMPCVGLFSFFFLQKEDSFENPTANLCV